MGWRRTSIEEARRVLQDSSRIAFAWECRAEPATLYGIASRLGRREGSLKSVAKSLNEAGAIRAEHPPGGKGKVWIFGSRRSRGEVLAWSG